MKVTELKNNLKTLSKEELIKEISELFKKSTFVKEHYINKFYSKSSLEILNKYKRIIKNEFLPTNGFGKARLSVAKKAISDFSKVSNNTEFIAELMIYYVEVSVEYTNTYGDITESFYNSMEGMYDKALNLIMSEDHIDKFQKRCFKILEDSEDTGWGFNEQLTEIFYNYIA
ncbi:hypothetical protein DSLASN_22900 [Desulfoluna limicola]|uniref:Uncharacterized protein n=1 Tax=Desulfoluna limicola TaxID=2810562 RepID=A0ABM7PHJ7_9BACT|nr:DUF6155 family protein [Desulfoluna limicola]BCS96658.1 hypothetical protein DSLASN_22900 [Desulfoluna limicola]